MLVDCSCWGKTKSSSDRPSERKSLSGEDLCLLHWDDVFAFSWPIMRWSSVITWDLGGVLGKLI